MIQTLTKLIKFLFWALLVLLGVTFGVSNRARIDLTFYPLPYAFSMPIFVFAIVIFAFGVLMGWSLTRLATLKNRRISKEAHKRIEALENELAALRSEQLIKPAQLAGK